MSVVTLGAALTGTLTGVALTLHVPSVLVRPMTAFVPAVPAVKMTPLPSVAAAAARGPTPVMWSTVPVFAVVMVPLLTDQVNVAAGSRGAEAMLPVEPAQSAAGAWMAGAGAQTWTFSCVVPR